MSLFDLSGHATVVVNGTARHQSLSARSASPMPGADVVATGRREALVKKSAWKSRQGPADAYGGV